MISNRFLRGLFITTAVSVAFSIISTSCIAPVPVDTLTKPTSEGVSRPTSTITPITSTMVVASMEAPLPTPSLTSISSVTTHVQEVNISMRTQWKIGDINNVAWSPDSMRFAIAYGDNGIYGLRLFSAANLAEVWSVQTGLASGLAFSSNGDILAVSPYDTGIQLWNVDIGVLDREILDNSYSCYGGPTSQITFSQDNHTIITSNSNGGHGYPYSTRIYLWDADSGKCIGNVIDDEGWLIEFAASPDGRYIALSLNHIDEVDRDQVHVWDLRTSQLVCEFPGYGVAYSPLNDVVATSNFTRGEIEIWNIENCQNIQSFDDAMPPHVLVFSPDGHFLASGREGIDIWNINNGVHTKVLEELSGEVWELVFSPDGRYLLSVTKGFTDDEGDVITLWEIIP